MTSRSIPDTAAGHADENPAWWRSAVVYQVYPRSFADSDGDGVGDIRGIIEHLDHISLLGVDVIWLSPVYRSPQDDNGYDISDYYDVDPSFGSLADLDELIDKAHAAGMRVIMDLVVNHTSDEHGWFTSSRTSRDAATADWYIWRDPQPGTVGGEPGSEPNNWGSFFSGSAWKWVPERGQYYLHLFSAKQPDLNWDNDELRAAVFTMMNWWLDRGIDGFRMDVINFISKDPRLPDGKLLDTGYGDGSPSFSYGPRIHDYLAEMQREVFAQRPACYLTVGEMPAVTPEQAARFTDSEHGQLNMVFQFEHVDLDSDGGKWQPRPVTALDLKRSLSRWQDALARRGWNSLYWSNHDQPRAVSRFGNDRAFWFESATALATVLHLHRGTPFVYQGEEIGMTNMPFRDIGDFRDIESVNHYRTVVDDGRSDPSAVLDALRRKSRDNARTPMQWSRDPHGGFTSAVPWIPANPNHSWLNAADQRDDPGSVFAHYRRLIGIRHDHPVVVEGDFTLIDPDDPRLYAYARRWARDRLAVYANLSDDPLEITLQPDDSNGELILSNHSRGADTLLRPWEVRVLLSRT